MDNAVFVGLSHQMILRREMDIIANNIANMDTTGFKVESMMQRTEPGAPAMTLGGPRPVKFVAPDGVARDFGQGVLTKTGATFDMAIEGKGFFQIQSPDGPRFTRDGRFTVDPTGRLTTQAGLPVLDEGGGEIQIDMERGEVAIGPDGTMSQGNERVGKVGVFEFANPGALEKAGDNLFRNTSNLAANPSLEARVRQGHIEGSNVRPVLEITRMVEVSRAYERTARMMDSESELSRRAVERLGKVQ
ncbi:flagellar basal-body rod protein FlgF [Phenylobacterium sp. SCN 70-31]|uniref:flagellar basal-body rod protein FlgF n=1 Tax=Phenylobacterium sp. SCN 70-31 TaxID=1660129 RepID=UPI00086EA5B2|nr:flagellar basal-body rod protein FlgF [Phenylobacterium sp. SCN 70-31]ODT88689.1 MAG: flagellar basal-body rod protein FlgF [Phenylobacterium sp. SCN 70-31]